ncbi:EAL domain-containing protein [Moritella viscosa]|uniref:Diguanylate cyclase/phosphodiesterase n=1 Tax=Moritella viscosa TaxID=80854 RepID=A0A090IED3_9GAMM|nr:EAL domain-containing protein [Moritella viscosa]CED60765.1 putative membrane associated signaling protein, GGDEF family protein [Moritella viscosa]SGY96531.1 Diguanylate cyclase/phosphodiesterase [Moritella viscosa]SGZ09177.1 Diguanylate cyclase/phosphodiesterase [Moritella viscosa]SGZ15108.1 Diguanylate cyclase/phosphodiesterase [Moritella viscosa]SHO10885.1 Diguanylate cyclase/phosphodiesterase [Moritella viscosa]
MTDYFRCNLSITFVFLCMLISSLGFSYQSLNSSLAIQGSIVNDALSQKISLDSITDDNAKLLTERLGLSQLFIQTESISSSWDSNINYPTLIQLIFPQLAKKFSGATDLFSYKFKLRFNDKDNAQIKLLSTFIVSLFIAYLLCLASVKRLLVKLERNILKEIGNTTKPNYHASPAITRLLAQHKADHHKELQDQHDKIEALSKQINMDNLTGLYNRFYFRGELVDILSEKNESQSAIIALIRATALGHTNKHRGFQRGDTYLKDISNILKQCTKRYPDSQLYRVSGPDFAIIIPNMTAAVAHKLAREIKANLDDYQSLHDLENVAYIGITTVHSGQQPEQVLARADTALAKAQLEGPNHWAFQQQDAQQENQGQSYWKDVIEEIINKRSLMLLSQPVQPIHRNMKNYQEIYTRFIGSNNAMLPTHTLFAMAQRLDYTVKLDQIIIENIISNSRTQMDGSSRWGVNLTSQSVQSSAFIVWLERLLLREPNIATNLVFEIDEVILERNIVSSKRVIDMLRRVGSRSAISKFGHGISSFKLFRELKPDYIKIDSGLIQSITDDNASQQFLRMIVDVAHRMSCQVIAEGVEDLAQKQLLESMYVDGIQGYLISKPAPLSKIAC